MTPSVPLSDRLREVVPTSHLQDASLLAELARRWTERQRFWHGPRHLLAMLEEIIATTTAGDDRDTLLLAAAYHDAIYDPTASDNEEASAQLLERQARDASSPIITRAAALIRASAWQTEPTDDLTARFFALDTRQLADDCPLGERLAYEHAIFREFQFTPWATYQAKRREFLESWATRFPEHRTGVAQCLELLTALQPRVAIYPGSFNPFHLGHLSILRQAESAFDKVIVSLGVNRQKAGSVKSLRQRQEELQRRLRFHEVAAVPGLITRYIDELPFNVTIVRGIRDGTDLEAELRYARFLNELRPGTQVIWISCEPHLQHLSSNSICELESIEPHAGTRYIPNTAQIYDIVPR